MSVSGPLKNAYVEEWMRNALYLPKRPALLMLNGGGGSRKPASDEDILEPRTGSPPLYGYGGDKGDLFEYYDAFGVHSQAMHEAVWKLDHLDKYNFHALVQVGKSTPKPAKWHPGPGGHLLRAQILAHHYLRLLDEAIISVLAALNGENTMLKLETLLETTTPLEQDPTVNEFKLPPPLYCDDFFCGSPASCAMTFEPIAQGSLLELVVSPPEPKTAKPTIESQNNSVWHTQLITYDQNAVVNARNRGAQYLDMKYVLQGNKYAGPLVLGVKTHKKHHMLFCQPPGSGQNQAPIGRNSSVLVDGKDSPFELEDSFYLTHTIRAPCWATKHQLEPGNHTITITPTNADGKYISLSAVIWF
ncbi:hypothetical protein Naga_100056g3 [Nannochloropsis gaditana]|uniref:Uncharacterized protein n=1 Tax=Nannochloropsis gaditana TaxID=72520 RepID=W7U2Y5_9STRA|nr:hypothetical protein Naga_100056g3 [Nannochloropsis gaditana]